MAGNRLNDTSKISEASPEILMETSLKKNLNKLKAIPGGFSAENSGETFSKISLPKKFTNKCLREPLKKF